MITDSRPIWDASLAEILSQPATPGTRASATDIPGVNLEWMATDAYPEGAWFGDCGQPTLAQLYALPTAYLATGARASVNGVQYTYGAAGWVEAGGGLTPYADYTTLSAQAPTVGKIAQIPRLCGNGYFALRGNGTRWEVCPGESIVRDAGAGSAGYDLTATGTEYVPLASYTIPAGLIGDGEEWEADFLGSAGTHGGATSGARARIDGAVLFSQLGVAGSGRGCRNRGAFVRLGNIATVAPATFDIYGNAAGIDSTVNFEANVTIDAGWVPVAVGSELRLRQWTFRRIG